MASDNGNLPSSRKEKLFRLVVVSFGLLCVLQAALNISLRLTLYSSDRKSPGIEASFKNLTEERDELKRKLADFNSSDRKSPGIEASCKSLTEERDELKRKLADFNSSDRKSPGIEASCKSLTEERDELKRKLADFNSSDRKSPGIEASCKNLTEERDELKKKLADFNSSDRKSPGIEASCKNLTEERDELKRKLADFNRTTLDMKDRLKTLTEERDELKMKLNDFIKEWTYFNGSLYYVSSRQKTWQESRDYCRQKGADLMIINSKEEQNFTRQLRDNLWIGLTDREREGEWKWVDGTPLTMSFWMTNEPNSYARKEEDCGEIRYHKEEFNWNDKPCDHANFWICEMKLPL